MVTLVTFITFRADELAFRFDELAFRFDELAIKLAIKLATQVTRFLSAIKKPPAANRRLPRKEEPMKN